MGNKIFIGARKLDENEAIRLLPNYKKIIEQIEEYRTHAKEKEHLKEKSNQEYNNTISIIGKRGTGKTSILYTIKNKLKNDIVLPIIKPDNLSESISVLACVMGYLKKEMDDLLKQVKNPENMKKETFQEFFKDCNFIENNSCKKAYEKMFECYACKNPRYQEILVNEYNNQFSYAKKYAESLNADENFILYFHEFLQELLKLKKKLYLNSCQEKNVDYMPMLILMIDDIDLRSTKVMEVIDVLLCYVNHHRVISLVSADYETFTNSFLISLLNKEGLLNQFELYRALPTSEEGNSLFVKKMQLSNDYMKKIMPPACRFEIVSYDDIAKGKYTFFIENRPLETMMELLFQLVQLCRETKEHAFDNENIFYYYTQEGRKEPLSFFFSFMDNTARGLVNVYYVLKNIVDSFESMREEERKKNRFSNIKSLVDTIISSSKNLSSYKNELYEKYIKWSNSEASSRLDFISLGNLDKGNNNEKILNCFHLMYFISLCLGEIDYDIEAREEAKRNAIELLLENNAIEKGKLKPIFISEKNDGFFTYAYSFSLNITDELAKEHKKFCEKGEDGDFYTEDNLYYTFYSIIKRWKTEEMTEEDFIVEMLKLFENENKNEKDQNPGCMDSIYEKTMSSDLLEQMKVLFQRIISTSNKIKSNETNPNETKFYQEILFLIIFNYLEFIQDSKNFDNIINKIALWRNRMLSENITKYKDLLKDSKGKSEEDVTKFHKINLHIQHFLRLIENLKTNEANQAKKEKLQRTIEEEIQGIKEYFNTKFSKGELSKLTIILNQEKIKAIYDFLNGTNLEGYQRGYLKDGRTKYNWVVWEIIKIIERNNQEFLDKSIEDLGLQLIYQNEKTEKLKITLKDYFEIREKLKNLSYRYDLVCGASVANEAYKALLQDTVLKLYEEDAETKKMIDFLNESYMQDFFQFYLVYLQETNQLPKESRLAEAKSFLRNYLEPAKQRFIKINEQYNAEYELEDFEEKQEEESKRLTEKLDIIRSH